MWGNVPKKVLSSVLLLVIVSFLIFLLVDLAPGDAAESLAGDNPDPAAVEQIRESLHLDDQVVVRYGRWLGDVAQGDLGTSFATREPVSEMLMHRLPVTLSIVLLSVVFGSMAGLALGIIAAVRRRGPIDWLVTSISSAALAFPPFWIALVLVVAVAVNRSWLPAIGYENLLEDPWQWLRHLILPAVSLGALLAAEIAMQLRASLIDALSKDYVQTARAKGLTSGSVVGKHALKNALVPVVTVLGFRVAQMLGGSVIIEQVFAMNGLGTLAVQSTTARDVPVLLGIVVLTTVIVLLINMAVDVFGGYLNPKMRGLR